MTSTKVENDEVIYFFDENGCLHNEDGHAVISKVNGFKEYRIHGKPYPDLLTVEQKDINRKIRKKFSDEVDFETERTLVKKPDKVNGAYPYHGLVVYTIEIKGKKEEDNKIIYKSCHMDEWKAYNAYAMISTVYPDGIPVLKTFIESIESMERRSMWEP